MKTPNGLKIVMSVSDEEEKTNKSLNVDFQYAQTPDATAATQVTVYNSPDHAAPLIESLHAHLPDNSVKLQSILQKNKNDSILIITLMRGECIYHTWAPCGHDWSCVIYDWSEGPFF